MVNKQIVGWRCRRCKATVPADRTYILKQVETSLGIERFNQIMQVCALGAVAVLTAVAAAH